MKVSPNSAIMVVEGMSFIEYSHQENYDSVNYWHWTKFLQGWGLSNDELEQFYIWLGSD